MLKNVYTWKKFLDRPKAWYLELFISKNPAINNLPFRARREDIAPHSLILNSGQPLDMGDGEIEFYSGPVVCGKDGFLVHKQGSAMFSKGKFKEGSFLRNKKIYSISAFEERLNQYFNIHNFNPRFGEYLPEFLRNSNLDEDVLVIFSELFD